MNRYAFLFDENVPLVIPSQLNQKEPAIQVYTVGDGLAPDKGTPDPEILIWIETHECFLVTNNRASMPSHLHDHLALQRHIPGIIQLPKRLNIRAVLEDLMVIFLVSEPDEFRDQILYLPLRT